MDQIPSKNEKNSQKSLKDNNNNNLIYFFNNHNNFSNIFSHQRKMSEPVFLKKNELKKCIKRGQYGEGKQLLNAEKEEE